MWTLFGYIRRIGKKNKPRGRLRVERLWRFGKWYTFCLSVNI